MIDDWVDEIARCSRCDTVKPGGEFYRSKTTLSGLQSWCKQCVGGYIKRRYREEPEFRERILDNTRDWTANNKDRHEIANQQWRDRNRDRLSQYAREYHKRNPEVARRANRKRRSRQFQAVCVPYTDEQLAQRWEYYGGNCWICGDKATATDHVKPLSKGGAEMLCNLRPACQPCNSRKRDKWPFKVSD